MDLLWPSLHKTCWSEINISIKNHKPLIPRLVRWTLSHTSEPLDREQRLEWPRLRSFENPRGWIERSKLFVCFKPREVSTWYDDTAHIKPQINRKGEKKLSLGKTFIITHGTGYLWINLTHNSVVCQEIRTSFIMSSALIQSIITHFSAISQSAHFLVKKSGSLL